MKRIAGLVSGKRSKWVTLAVWIVLVAVLTAVLPSVSKEENNNAPNLRSNMPSVQADAVAEEQFSSGKDVPALIVWHRAGGLTEEDLSHWQKVAEQITASPVPEQTFVPPYHQMPLAALKGQLSKDQSTIVTTVLFTKEADADRLKGGISALKEIIKTEYGSDPFAASSSGAELSSRVTGPVGILIDATELFSNADVSLLIATVVLVLVILLLIYRSPILALIPIVSVGFAYGVISPILGFMAHKGWITVDAQAISIMTVLLFGAGTDYCLFLISRFRQLLTVEENKWTALKKSFTESSAAIAMSGITVVLSLLTLLFAHFGTYERFAVPFSLAIFIMGIASLTLVPALLAIIGRASFYPFVPRTPEMIAERARKKGKRVQKIKEKRESRIGSIVVRRPWIVVIVTLVFLGALASFTTQIKVTYDILSSFPSTMESREGSATIGEQFSPGELAPVKVMIDTQGKDIPLGAELAKQSFVSNVSEPVKGQKNAQIVAYDVELSINPYSIEAMERIPDLRTITKQSLQQAGIESPDQKLWISGQTATQYDDKHTTDRDTEVIIPIVIGLIALLLLIYLRSIVATVYLVATVILSYFSALGLGWLIIHYGLGADAIQGAIPLYAFVFLVALGEDYNIFMISSIWQKRKHMPLKQAIKEGVGETSSVITSAGIILAGTFAVLASLPIQVLVQFGIITAIGVLLDTFIVRPLLVPAITTLFGKYAFWPDSYTAVTETKQETQMNV